MNMRTAFTAGIIGMVSLAFVSSAEAKSTQDFVTTASIANEFEIESSRLALDKSQNKDVKDFAQRMVDDHTKTADKMKEALQSSKSNAQPAEKLDDKHQKMIDTLQNASGSDFDRQYIKMQTSAHKDAVHLFSGYAKHGKDPVIKKFAADTLPTLKDHLKHIKRLKVAS